MRRSVKDGGRAGQYGQKQATASQVHYAQWLESRTTCVPSDMMERSANTFIIHIRSNLFKKQNQKKHKSWWRMRSVKSANKFQDANSRNNSIWSTHSMHTHQSPKHARTTESHSNCAPLAYAPCPAVSDQEIHLCPKGTIFCKKKHAHTPENVLINHALCMQSLDHIFVFI